MKTLTENGLTKIMLPATYGCQKPKERAIKKQG
jgi:hypothetical protein